jgi:hypothetical protein
MHCPSFLRPTNLRPFWLKSLPFGVCVASSVEGLDLRRKDGGAGAGSGGAGGAAGGGPGSGAEVEAEAEQSPDSA